MIAARITHRQGAFHLDVALDIGPGVTAVFGPSGAGKTTLVSAIAGLIRPDQAQIIVGERVLTDTEARVFVPPARRRIGYVFQDARLFAHMSVLRNLLYGAPKGADPAEIIALLGIAPLLDRAPATLSGGEAQRVAIGRALLSAPDMLIMDEPLAALDGPRKDEILPYLRRLRHEAHIPILYVSHAMAEIAQIADALVVMRAGRIVTHGPLNAVLTDPALIGHLPVREAGAVLEGRIVAHHDDGLSEIDVPGGRLHLPQVPEPVGAVLRVRIAAQDVMLSRDRPAHISALNVLAGTIKQVRTGSGPGAMVTIKLGESRILARITQRSAQAMALSPDQPIYAVIKTVAVAQGDIGHIGNGGAG